jgi:4-hydroxy-3-methylbut-2-enyl diphosphate reductase IspH
MEQIEQETESELVLFQDKRSDESIGTNGEMCDNVKYYTMNYPNKVSKLHLTEFCSCPNSDCANFFPAFLEKMEASNIIKQLSEQFVPKN